MGNKKIEFTLNPNSITQAINEVQKYKASILEKMSIYRNRLAKEIKENAQIGFNTSLIDNRNLANVDVETKDDGDTTIIIASGEDAIWIEFGAGVYFNGDAGTSPNPYGYEQGFTIGSYGKGKGKQKAWGYLNDDGQLIITHGTLATMPMYNSVQSVITSAIKIAREVFE